MTHAEKCPVCYGKGVLSRDDYTTTTARIPRDQTCHGCNGKGWVTVNDDSMFTIKISESSYPYAGDTRKGGE